MKSLPIEIIQTRYWALIAFLLGLLFTALGGLLLYAVYAGLTTANVEQTLGVGYMAVVFFGSIALIAGIAFLKRKTGLRIDEEGITVLVGIANGMPTVKWRDIKRIRTQHLPAAKLVLIDLENPEWYLEHTATQNLKALRSANIRHGTPILFNARSLKTNFWELERMLSKEVAERKMLD